MHKVTNNVSKEKPNLFLDTFFIRFIAIILITNSHLDRLYPIPQFGTGGAIGNTLFFMMSGYGLYKSYLSNPLNFNRWYGRRISRIYPSLIIAVGCIYLFYDRGWSFWNWSDYITSFFWPTPYWFITALMLFYIIFFIIVKQGRPILFLFCIVFLTLPYIFYYMTHLDLSRYTIEGPGYFKYIYYLQIMCWGGFWASREKQIISGKKRELWGLLLLLTSYYLFLIGVEYGPLSEYQFITHLLLFPISYLFLSISRSNFVLKVIMEKKYISPSIIFIGGLTLEIYFLQNFIYSNYLIKNLLFPVNIIIFWVVVIFLSFVLQKAAIFLRNFPTRLC